MNQIGATWLRQIPHFKGKQRVAKYLYRHLVNHAKDVSVKGHLNASYLLPNLKENVAFDIFINGIYEWDTHKFLVDNIAPNGVLLDLGANIGAVTIPLCLKRKDIRCICVEASPWVFKYLEKNIAANSLQDRVTCFNKALFDEDNESLLFYSPSEKFGKGSLSPVFTSEGIPVMSVKLDTLLIQCGIERVDLIKIDIEGYEYYAFKGGESLLRQEKAPGILFEFVDWAEEAASGVSKGDAQSLLLQYGYSLFRMHGTRLKAMPYGEVLKKGNDMLYGSKTPVK